MKSIRKLLTIGALGGLGLLGAGCGSLQKDINVPLPQYDNQLVVECYLEPGVVPRLTVTESVPYLSNGQAVSAKSQSLTLSNGQVVQLPTDVTVRLTLPSGQVVPLYFLPGIDPTTGKYFTHVGTAPLAAQVGQSFALDVQDTRSRHVTGTATVPAFIPIDSVKYKFNDLTGDNKKAYFQTKWTDPGATTDYYRLLLHKGKPSNNSETDNDISDQLFNGQPYAQVTTYRFRPNDTVTATLYHIDSLYYSFRRSTREARSANGNPFAQPSTIRSTVQGGVGVFTVLVHDQKRVKLRP
ncbi:MAG: DUF4249 domain-containing protein [Janthinobacterium lividum]